MKLEVGQFARLKSGYSDELGIGKIDFVANCGVVTIDFKNKALSVFVEDIKKASYDIIDILEVGDYVNGREVVDIFYDANDDIMNVCVLGSIVYDNNEIKSVITHDQMEQMAYKVVE